MNIKRTGTDEPLISVIVPIYNVEKYIRKCIESIIHQTYKNIEILLVDDGSFDNCPAICDEYKKLDNVRIIHKKNGGLVSARKAGIELSIGDYVCFVDGDDWIAEDHLSSIVKAIVVSGADVIIHEFVFATNDHYERADHKMLNGFFEKEDIEKKIIPTMLSTEPFYTFGIAPSICTKAFKRSVLYDVQMNVPESLTLGEDAAVTYPVLEKAGSVMIIDEYGYMYRVNNQSMTRSYNSKLSTNAVELIDYLHSWALNSKLVSVILPQLQDYCCYIFGEVVANEILGSITIENALVNIKKVTQDKFINESVCRKENNIRTKLLYRFTKHKQWANMLKWYWTNKQKQATRP